MAELDRVAFDTLPVIVLRIDIDFCFSNLYSNTNRLKNNWSRPGNWDAGFVNDNNGHGSQGYNNQGYHGYGY
jgi:hypothetical protein